ncbi:MAG: FtsX-like permease family protein [Deltaproteobacteria bacterium]|nr:FtsX-like permease family protein [Deltaproteobacteria bacterium]
MRVVTQTAYFVRQGVANLSRHPLYATVGVLTLTVSLILVGFLGLFLLKANTLVDRLAGGLKLTVYMAPDVTRPAADELAKVLSSQWPEVKEVSYHTELEDRERNLKLLPAELVADLEPELVPAQPYLEVILDVDRLDDVRAEALVKWFSSLNQVQGVDEVLFGSQKIAAAFSLLSGARTLGVFISLVIVLAAIFFVLTTTRLIVEGRRREIEVLLLVGATPAFIRLPHYIEGTLQGIAAGLLSYAVVWLLQRHLLTTLRGEAFLQVPLDLLPHGMALWFLAGGVALGLVGSALGLARHLRFFR